MVIREDADIGSVVVGDIHKKNTYVQLRLGEAINLLASLRHTQLSLLYNGLGLQKPTDDIADDMAVTCTLVGEFATSIQGGGRYTPKGFVAEVQDAMNLEGLDYVPRPLQRHMDNPDSSSTQDMTDSLKDVPDTPLSHHRHVFPVTN